MVDGRGGFRRGGETPGSSNMPAQAHHSPVSPPPCLSSCNCVTLTEVGTSQRVAHESPSLCCELGVMVEGPISKKEEEEEKKIPKKQREANLNSDKQLCSTFFHLPGIVFPPHIRM